MMLKGEICLEPSAIWGKSISIFASLERKKRIIIQPCDPFQNFCSACLYTHSSVSAFLHYFRCPRLEGACTTSPCQHGGTCTDHWSWQQCQCKDGLTGDHCEKCRLLLSFFLIYISLYSYAITSFFLGAQDNEFYEIMKTSSLLAS